MTSIKRKPKCVGFLRWDVTVSFTEDYFRKYVELIKSAVATEQELLTERWKRIEKSKNELTSIELEALSNDYSNEDFDQRSMEQLAYRSFIVSVFIFIEETLNTFCEHLRRNHSQIFSYKDMAGIGIAKSILYIETVGEGKFPINQHTRTQFQIARKIRNAIVHNGFALSAEDRKFLLKHKKVCPFVTFDAGGYLTLTSEYAHTLLDLNKIICKELVEICERKNEKLDEKSL